MRIIEKVRAKVETIAKVATGSVVRGRNGDALIGWNTDTRELADHPSICELIVEHDRVAAAIILTNASKAVPDSGNANGSKNRRTRGFIKDLNAFVDHLNILRLTDLPNGVGRSAVAADTGKNYTVKV